MHTLYDVQEWLKQFGYINLMPNRLDAIYLMAQEIKNLHEKGILADDDHDYLTASMILKKEERLERVHGSN
ncbi:MAG: YqgQ family protein [Streptococcaceae bacterium]|jgi:uncharacterized protein YqgQ|nr:YqgQ family protein [Streptococcaceae bacterium]